MNLPVSWLEDDELPYQASGAYELADQTQLDPLPLLAAVVVEPAGRGGVLVQQHRVDDVTVSDGLFECSPVPAR